MAIGNSSKRVHQIYKCCQVWTLRNCICVTSMEWNRPVRYGVEFPEKPNRIPTSTGWVEMTSVTFIITALSSLCRSQSTWKTDCLFKWLTPHVQRLMTDSGSGNDFYSVQFLARHLMTPQIWLPLTRFVGRPLCCCNSRGTFLSRMVSGCCICENLPCFWIRLF